MVAVQDARHLLRQQLAFAALHHRNFEVSKELLDRRANLQASLLCINIGLIEYFKAVFSLDSAEDLNHLSTRVLARNHSYKGEEVLRLLEQEGSWLSQFSQVIASAQVLPKHWQVPETQHRSIIARVPRHRMPHWTQLDAKALATFIEKSNEMLGRHSEFDQEY